MTDGKPISLAEFARRRGVSREAVSQAVKKGRIREAVVYVNGKPKISDAELAAKEWDATTDYSKAPPAVKLRAAAERGHGDGEPLEYDLALESAREKHWKANLAQLEYETRAGKLIPVDEARATVVDRFTEVKTKLLGLPTRIRQRLGTLTTEDVRVIDELVREALESLADGDDD